MKLAFIGGPIYDQLYREQLTRFTEATGIPTELVLHLPQHELNERLLANYADGDGRVSFDLITCHSKYAPSQAHFLRPLDDLLDAEEIDAYVPSMIEFARIEGQLYQLPRNCDVRTLVYRRDALADPQSFNSTADAEPLPVPETWEALLETAEALAAPSEGRSGFVFTGVLSGLFGSFYELVTSAGGDLVDDELNPRFVSEAGEWSLDLLRRLYQGTAVTEMRDFSYDEVAFHFAAGSCAMYCEWPGYWGLISDPARSEVASEIGVAVYPAGPDGVRKVYAGSHSFAIPTSAHDVAASVELLRFLTSDESLLGEASRGSFVPRHTIMREVADRAEPGSIEAGRWSALEETLDAYLLLPPKTTLWPHIEDALWPALRRGYTAEISVRAALEEAALAVSRAVSAQKGALH